MTAGVFDAAAIAARRRQLFPPEAAERWSWDGVVDRERLREAKGAHCGICPKDADEECSLDCEAQRRALDDGVTVT